MVKDFKDISVNSLELFVEAVSDCTDSFLFMLDTKDKTGFISEQAGAIFNFPEKKIYPCG